MPVNPRRREAANRGGEQAVAVFYDEAGKALDLSPSSDIEFSRLRLRRRWELASVLNFLSVFEPVIGNELKMSAEEIEMALIKPDDSLAMLHVTLLKGIPPVNKNLTASGTWVTVLCKKLAPWWPWVAQGELPLKASKGEEVLRYKELDPEVRLVMLKALCEIRAEQDDSVFFINDAIKQGSEASSFRKEHIGVDSNGMSYWYDVNSVLGYRLYGEIIKSTTQSKLRGKACVGLPGVHMQWETLATTLDEFRKVLAELSSSNKVVDAAVCRTIENDAIPIVDKLEKRKERALKRKQREQCLLDGVHSFHGATTRSCRSQKPVSYTFDEYDRMVDEAIQQTKKGKGIKERRYEKHNEVEKQEYVASGEDFNKGSSPSGEGFTNSAEEDTESDEVDEEKSDHEDAENNSLAGERKNESDGNIEAGDSDTKVESPGMTNHVISNGEEPQKRKRIPTIDRQRSPITKNRLRQRPVRNSAIENNVAPDSDDSVSDSSWEEGTYTVSDSDEEEIDR